MNKCNAYGRVPDALPALSHTPAVIRLWFGIVCRGKGSCLKLKIVKQKANKEKENETRVPRRFTKHKCVITEDIKSGFKNQTYRGGWLHLANR